MPDPNLRKAIRQKLEIDTDTPLTKADMLELRRLDASRFNITNLTGLEHAINLEFLIVAQNKIQDIRPLANLTKLTFIDAWGDALLDFTLPETQKWAIDQAKAIASCGLFDGIFLDHWSEGRRLREMRSLEAEHIARDNILQGIRAVVDEDFLICVFLRR